jgi:DNA helicase IV
MSTNYRSPAEVFDLAAQVVVPAYPNADLPRAVRSTGVAPELRTADDVHEGVRAGVRDLLGAVEGTVGVIAPPSLVVAVTRALDEARGARDERVLVVTALQAKGLEYDGVLVVDPDTIVAESAGGLRSLYVALTRPTQRLVTLDLGPDPAWRKSLA